MAKNLIKLLKAFSLPLIMYMVFLMINFERFSSFNIIQTIFIQSLIPMILAYGVSLGWLSGVMDFTVGSRVMVVALVGCSCAKSFGIGGLIIGSLLASVILGAVTGGVINAIKVPSMITTLGLAMAFEIIGYYVSKISMVTRVSRGNAILGERNNLTIVAIVVIVLFYFIFYKFGTCYQIRAVGAEPILAGNMGINIKRTKLIAFLIGSIFVGIAAILQVSYTGSVTVLADLESAGMLFKPLMSVWIGIALGAWCNLGVGIFIGSFTVNILFVGLVSMGLNDAYQNVALGVFIIIVLFITASKESIFNWVSMLMKRKKAV